MDLDYAPLHPVVGAVAALSELQLPSDPRSQWDVLKGLMYSVVHNDFASHFPNKRDIICDMHAEKLLRLNCAAR